MNENATTSSPSSSPEILPPRELRFAFWALLAGLLLARLAAVYTESVNWDEFGLLGRAWDTARTGELVGGARPGLATLLFVPLAERCMDAVAAIQWARLLWTAVTAAYVLGFWTLLRHVLRGRPHAWHAAALGVGLLVLVPVFLRWSIQVRTDQPALALGLWGGVALLASRRRVAWALAAGVLFGVGFLITQKLVYVAALVGLLVIGRQYCDGIVQLRRDGLRLAFCVAGTALTIGTYDVFVSLVLSEPIYLPISGQMRAFEYYRSTVGYSVYRGMLPSLVPHVTVAVLTVVAMGLSMRGRLRRQREAAVAFGVLALGVAVGGFHASAFPYFWMTIGMFPAAAGALAFEPTMDWLGTGRARRILLVGGWTVLVLVAVPTIGSMLIDTQRVQRESLAFVARNFDSDQHGFHPERALVCMRDPDPFPMYISPRIHREFLGPDREANLAALFASFRDKPVMFVLESFRLRAFPGAFQRMMRDSYVQYWPAVFVPGHWVSEPVEGGVRLETMVAGRYRWRSGEDVGGAGALLRVDGRVLRDGDTLELEAGEHRFELLGRPPGGILTLDLQDPPLLGPAQFFSVPQLRHMAGLWAW